MADFSRPQQSIAQQYAPSGILEMLQQGLQTGQFNQGQVDATTLPAYNLNTGALLNQAAGSDTGFLGLGDVFAREGRDLTDPAQVMALMGSGDIPDPMRQLQQAGLLDAYYQSLGYVQHPSGGWISPEMLAVQGFQPQLDANGNNVDPRYLPLLQAAWGRGLGFNPADAAIQQMINPGFDPASWGNPADWFRPGTPPTGGGLPPNPTTILPPPFSPPPNRPGPQPMGPPRTPPIGPGPGPQPRFGPGIGTVPVVPGVGNKGGTTPPAPSAPMGQAQGQMGSNPFTGAQFQLPDAWTQFQNMFQGFQGFRGPQQGYAAATFAGQRSPELGGASPLFASPLKPGALF